MKQLLISTFLLFVSCQLNAQSNSFEHWDQNYFEMNLDDILNLEKEYADSIETHHGDSLQFYTRADKYRFAGTFTGNWRTMSYERRTITDRTFRMFGVDNRIIKKLKNEVEISTDEGTTWMSIQPQLEKSFKKEVDNNSDVYLYTIFVNHHSISNGLVNLFLISEFNANRN